MPDINSGSDLMTTIGDTNTRLKKVERQLQVPRKGASSVVSDQQAALNNLINGVTLATPDTVNVVATSNCLIHVYAELNCTSAAGGPTVFLFLNGPTKGASTTIFSSMTTGYFTIQGGSTTGNSGLPNSPVGAPAVFAWSDAGLTSITLRFKSPSGVSSFKDRKLFAWVQPF